jgi:hypothetical protein
MGCKGIVATRGKYGGTYCAPQWAIHFANWLDARFYVETINAYRLLSEAFYGKDAQLKRFTRELAAENFNSSPAPRSKHYPNPQTFYSKNALPP